MKKRAVLLGLLLAATVAFAGCGKKQETNTDAPAADTTADSDENVVGDVDVDGEVGG